MAVWTINEQFSWFCGVEELPENVSNASYASSDVTENPDNSDPWMRRLCALSAVGTGLHSVFLIAFVAVLIALAFCQSVSASHRTKYLQRCQGHGLRWSIISFLLVVRSFAIAEGVLTDATQPEIYPTQLHLYLPSVCALLTTFAAAFYFNTMERGHRLQMSLFSLLYWTLCFIEQAVNLRILLQLDLGSVQVLRFDLSVGLLSAYSISIILDLIVLKSLVACRNPSYRPTPTEETIADDIYYVQDYVNAPSQVTLTWLTKLFRLGRKRPLERKDLGMLPERHTSQKNFQQFKEVFLKEKAKAVKSNREVSLFKVFGLFCGTSLLSVCLLKFVSILKFITPAAIRGIVLYASAQNLPTDNSVIVERHFITVGEFLSNGYILLFILFITKVTNILCTRAAQYYLTVQAIHIRTAVQGMVYDKSLRLSLIAGNINNGVTAGKLVNYITTDPANLQQMFVELYSILVTTISMIITMVLLYLLLGVSALLGAVALLLVMPLITLAGRGMSKFQKKALTFSDGRLKYCNELLQAIKLVKMYGWEDVFRHTIESVRKHELLAILVRNIFFALSTTIASAGPIMITLISFGSYTFFSGQPLTPEVALPSMSLFFMFENSLFYFPFYISYMVTGVISTRRLQAFLMTSEVAGSSGEGQESGNVVASDDLQVNFKPLNGSSSPKNGQELSRRRNGRSETNGEITVGEEQELELLQTNNVHGSGTVHLPTGVAVKIENGSFSWDSESESILHDINVEIPKGQLTVIVGSVGSGKSSLLSAILREMITLRGRLLLSNSDVAYVAQKPWIINASISDNITIGCDMDEARYKEVISACALQLDLEELPAGDQTEIGEKGINLSGGQKQRISLARALYSSKPTVIMDDPLSALDAHVSHHVIHQGIVGLLSRERRTAILVTNQLNFMPLADHVLVMVEGRVEFQGTQDEIEENDYNLCQTGPQILSSHHSQPGQSDALAWMPDEQTPMNKQLDQASNHNKERKSSRVESGPTGRLIKAEERKLGSISHRVYVYLIRMTGWFLLAWVVALFVFNGCLIRRAFKLAEWSEAGVTQTNASGQTRYYIMSYTAWSGASFFAYFICDITRTIAAYYATRNLFQRLLNNITRLPLRFFDTTPTGRILNRFSSDTNSIDQYLFQNLDAVLFNVVEGLFLIILNTIVAPAYLIAIVPLAVINFLVVRFFLASSREIKRLESISRSPILACFTQTLDGLPTIRAYGYQKHFQSILLSRVNENCTTYLFLQASNLWLNIRLDFLSAFLVLAAGVSALLASSFDGVSASLVGLAIAVAARSSHLVSYVARYYGELEIRMNAVERVEHYTSLPTEKYDGIEPGMDWPASGGIEFSQLSARYDITLQPVLHGIDLQIKPGEKVGICGRTGSGKSSLTLALLQLIDTHEGSLVIDGQDISRISLSILRQRLSVIPQDPVLFTGTIRKNLDPTGKKNDGDLWEALQIAQVKGLVSELGGLDFQVSEGGENFSVGQRQLFCLARAFLRKSHILIMDEATASIDLEMDKTLQQVVAEAFKDQTVLIVAHRVVTIMNCDTILVMSGGEIIEKGSPQELLAITDGEFASLVQASGSMIR